MTPVQEQPTTAFTPGPWRVEADTWIVSEADRDDDGLPSVVAQTKAPDEDRAEADARLIAAAPDLLAALHGLSGLLADIASEPELDAEILRAISAADMAVANAEGRQP